MRITLRLIVSLLFSAVLVAAGFSFWEVRAERNRQMDDLERRAALISEGLHETLAPLLTKDSTGRLARLVKKFQNRERLLGISIFSPEATALTETSGLSIHYPLDPETIRHVGESKTNQSYMKRFRHKNIQFYLAPIVSDDKTLGVLALVHDATFIDTRLEGIWRQNFYRLLVLSFLIVVATLFVVRWSVTGPIAQVSDWIKQLRLGQHQHPPYALRGDVLGPLAKEVSQMAMSLQAARAAAEKEAQLRLSGEAVWTPEKLKEHVRSKIGNKALYLVSNREPYMHMRQKRAIELIVPASGMVTALEPVMRATGGTWIAHGSGDADREVCDASNKVRVPPNEPPYTLKRVWLTKEEENGHYYGFSNEGLWPLCHITHTRPVFRLDDWVQYQNVNAKFAESLLEEIKDEESPLILIQDYHFAILPLLIKKKRPDAKIAIFWHIPWPNPESFGICPWKQEILMGMMGADIIGFHTQFHCNNFLDTVDNTLECKITWENFSLERGGHETLVRPFPISVAFTEAPNGQATAQPQDRETLKSSLLKDYGLTAKYLAVGVDRLDYTKGIIERFRAIERFLEIHPQFIGQFTFVELGAPSRTHIQKYYDFVVEVEKMAEIVNWKFQTKTWKPILLLKAHHSHETIIPFYKAADLCMVTSLHDGMNLVAKEFVSARSDEDGVLVLSQFTGASRELKDALIVNPYDIEAMAQSIFDALEMPPEERARRMKQMRSVVQDRNVFRWAGNIITAMSKIA